MTEDSTESHLIGLMRATQGGDKAAYAQLLSGLVPIVRRMARGRIAGAENVDDVVQDVLLSVHQVRHTYDPARPFLPWLSAITRNRLADAQRRLYRRSRGEVAVEFLPETFSEDATNDRDNALSAAKSLQRALGDLPPGQRQAVELLKLKEMSLREASLASGMSVGSLKVSMHRAMKKLRELVTK